VHHFPVFIMPLPLWFGLLLLSSLTGCQHTIHVNALPSEPTAIKIPRDVQVIVGPLSIEGADHMPGIPLLQWPHRDVSQAILGYLQRRETFSSVAATPADLALAIAPKLAMRSRERYYYSIRLQAEMRTTTRAIKTYVAEKEAEGSSVRWVTASDRDPIEKALQLALDDLLTEIETDRELYLTGSGRADK